MWYDVFYVFRVYDVCLLCLVSDLYVMIYICCVSAEGLVWSVQVICSVYSVIDACGILFMLFAVPVHSDVSVVGDVVFMICSAFDSKIKIW